MHTHDIIGKKWIAKGYAFGGSIHGVELWAHSDRGYSKRTLANAECDATMAAAADYSTGGERLTKQVAGPRYIQLPFYLDGDEAGRRLAESMAKQSSRSLNVAGNGIYTLEAKGMSQAQSDQWIFECLFTAHAIHRIERIQSGGQTGVDMSGAVAAFALNIPAKILFPMDFIQRHADGIDRAQDPEALLSLISERAAALIRPATQSSPKGP